MLTRRKVRFACPTAFPVCVLMSRGLLKFSRRMFQPFDFPVYFGCFSWSMDALLPELFCFYVVLCHVVSSFRDKSDRVYPRLILRNTVVPTTSSAVSPVESSAAGEASIW